MKKKNFYSERIKVRSTNKNNTNRAKVIVKYIFLCLFLVHAHFAGAQLSPADSFFFNQNFTDPAYSYDTSHPHIFQMPPVVSKQALWQRLDSLFPFTEANYSGSYKRLEVADHFYYDTALNNSYNWYYTFLGYGLEQTDPVINLNYTLDSYSRTASALYTPGTNTATSCETAFFIFPGSGANCTYQVATGTGYHSLFCDTKNNLKQYGDVFTFCKPNEDWRATLWNDKKLSTENGTSYLLNYLDGTNHNLSINANIEFLAFLKLLKSKYKKVVVLALSHGGLNTIISLSEVNVDGYLISGGYTAATYLVQSEVFQQQKYFGNTYNLHPPAVTKDNIIKANSEFLFAWSEADGQIENPNHYTQDYFGPLPNVSYYYAFPQHSFPYCSAIDSFVHKIQAKPKPFIERLAGCTADSLSARITFCGQPPFSFDVYKDSTLYNSYTSATDTFDITLTQEGYYSVSNLYDASNVLGYRSDTLQYIKDPAADLNVASRYFDCDSNNTKLAIQLNGTSPWIVNYNYNGALYSDTIYTNTKQYALQNGDITFLNVTDSNTCHKALTQTYNIADSLINIDTLIPEYSCDSAKMRIHIALQGRAPWKINYKKNGIADQFTIQTIDTTLYFENGLYEFINVTDSNLCSKVINQVFNFNESATNYTFLSRYFDCSIGMTRLNFQLEGKAPWMLHYSKNGVNDSTTFQATPATLTVDNGEYHFYDIRDSNNCTRTINEDFSVHDSLPQFQILSQAYSCDSNRTRIVVQMAGRSPWVLYYNRNGVSDSFMFNTAVDTLYLNNGNYSFYQLKDSNNCSLSLSEQFILNESLVGYTFLSRYFDCTSSMTKLNFQLEGKAPWILRYSKNGNIDSATFQASPATLTVDNGEYHFYNIRDSNSCIQAINEDYSVHDSLPQFQITGNGFLCLLGQTQLNYALAGRGPWTLAYLAGSTPVSVVTSNINNSLYLQNGIYTFLSVTDSNGCVQPINQALTIDENLPSLVSTQIHFDCTKDSFLLKVNLVGETPYKFYYTKNGVADSFQFEHNFDSVYISRGNYQFSSFVDSNNCSYIIDTNFSLTDSVPSLSILSSGFSCARDSNYIALKFAGKPNWQIQYTLDNINYSFSTSLETDTLWVGNGAVQLQQLTDFNGCTLSLSDAFQFQNHLPGAQLVASGYDCTQQKGYCVFNSNGNLPINLSYQYNGQPQSTLLGSGSTDTLATDTLWLDNGAYEFNQVSDLNGCVFDIGSTMNIDYEPLTFDYEITNYNCLNNLGTVTLKVPTGNPPYEISVTNNGVSDILSTATGLIHHQFIPGSFQVHSVTDITGCIIYPNVDLNISNDSLKDPTSIYLEGLKVKTDNTGSQYIWYYDDVPVDTTNVAVTDFIGNGMYYVGITNTNGCTYYTRPVLLNKGKFVVYPNPAKEEVNILIGLPKDTIVDVDLFDATGRLIKTINVKNGINTVSLKGLDNGVYIFKVNHKGIGYFFENIRVIKR